MSWAVLPLKDFVNAKQRLSGVLAPHERRGLFQAMVEDVLSTLTASPFIDEILLVSDDPGADLLARKYAAHLLREIRPGLNLAVQAAAEFVLARGGRHMLVIHGDLPLVNTADIETLFQNHPSPGITIATDLAGEGTNIMLCSSPDCISFHYGEHSCQLHSREAQAAGIAVRVLELPNAQIDIDEPLDLNVLLERLSQNSIGAENTRRFLQESGVQRRLLAMGIGDSASQSDVQTQNDSKLQSDHSRAEAMKP